MNKEVYMIYRNGKQEYIVGTLTKKLSEKDSTIEYIFDIDRDKLEKLQDIEKELESNPIPGLDLRLGYKQIYNELPFFIWVRVTDGRRGDIDEILEHYGMEHYDAFTMLIKNNGKSLDKWTVRETERSKSGKL